MKTKKENSDNLENLLKHSKENLQKYTQERVSYVYACFADILYTEKRKSCKLSRKQIIKVLKASNNLLVKNTPVDILQQLEDETGVILKLDDNDKETYAKLCGIADKLHDLSYLENNSGQYAYFLQRKDSWLTIQLYSCILLSLHQLYGFGYSRIETVLTDAENLFNGCSHKDEIISFCDSVIGIRFTVSI